MTKQKSSQKKMVIGELLGLKQELDEMLVGSSCARLSNTPPQRPSMTPDNADKRLWFLRLLKRTIEQTEADLLVGTKVRHIEGITVECNGEGDYPDNIPELRVACYNDFAKEPHFVEQESIYDTMMHVALMMTARAMSLMYDSERNDLLDIRKPNDSETRIPDAPRE